MAACKAVLNIAGEHFECDWEGDAPHTGWAHTNKKAQAIWTGHEEIGQIEAMHGEPGSFAEKMKQKIFGKRIQ